MITKEYINNDINTLLEDIVKEISVPSTKYDEAKQHYTAVGEWISDENGTLSSYKPKIFVQGSFALGTAIKPIDREEYDIDAVCLIDSSTKLITQEQLKNLVGDRLKENKVYSQKLEEKRRCWTLNYSEKSCFHLDILPAIPNKSTVFTTEDLQNLYNKEICITDNTRPDYRIFSNSWQKSNPQEYANWFRSMMQKSHLPKIVNEMRDSVEDVPIYKYDSVLQKVIKLLKRHRNIRYKQDEDKPISVIITTLAAKAYNGENDIYNALVTISNTMQYYIEYRNNGEYWIPNPVNKNENFADKWNETPRKRLLFFEWIESLKNIITDLIENKRNINEILDSAYGIQKREEQQSLQKFVSKVTNPITTMFNVSYREKLKWPLHPMQKVNLNVTFQRERGAKTYTYYSNGELLPKNGTLYFNVKTTTPLPYTIMWQVVNTGEDAKNHNDLRGKFFQTCHQNPSAHIEHTRYKGRHMIQASIIKGGMCVGQSQEFIINIT